MCHPKHIHSDRVSELSWAGYCILCTAVLKHAVRPISVCFSGWNTDARSRRKFPYQRLHWYNSGCFPSNFSKWWALNSAAVLFFSYQVFEMLGNPVVIQCLCFTPHTSSCDMRKPLSLEGWRSVLSNSPISFLLWEKCSFSWCLSHMHVYRHILTNGLYPAVLLFPKATVMHFHFILIFFICTSWPSVIHDHKKREWAVRANKMNISGTDMQDWAVQWPYRSLKYLLALLKANKNAFWTFEFSPYRQ